MACPVATNAPIAVLLLVLLSLHCISQPVLTHRGFLLDTARCFFPKSRIKLMLDMMQNASMNVFHWHLTDNEGFRVEWKRDGGALSSLYGRKIYSHSDISEIIRYAQARGNTHTGRRAPSTINNEASAGIDVIPEIDSPGHVYPFSLVYPEYMLPGHPDNFDLSGIRDVNELRWDLFHEMYPNFTSKYVHFGHDEIANNATEVQKSLDFVETVAQSLNRRPMIWNDPITKQGLAVSLNFTIQAWKGDAKFMQTILSAGYQTIISDWQYWYVGSGGSGPNGWYKHPASSYTFPTRHESNIIGAELCWWTEETDKPNQDLKWLHDAMMDAGRTMWCYKNPSCGPKTSPKTTKKRVSTSGLPRRTKRTTHTSKVSPTPHARTPPVSSTPSHTLSTPSTAAAAQKRPSATHTASHVPPTPSASSPLTSPAPPSRPASPSAASYSPAPNPPHPTGTTKGHRRATTPLVEVARHGTQPVTLKNMIRTPASHTATASAIKPSALAPGTDTIPPEPPSATPKTKKRIVTTTQVLQPWSRKDVRRQKTVTATALPTTGRLVGQAPLTRRSMVATAYTTGRRHITGTVPASGSDVAVSGVPSVVMSDMFMTFMAVSTVVASIVAIIATCYACCCSPQRRSQRSTVYGTGIHPREQEEPVF